MKSLFNRIAMALLISSLAGVSVFAKTKTETVRFPTNIKVNGTLINKGVYDLKYDDKTGELTIVKGGKVIARATASVEKRDSKASQFEFRSSGTGDDTQLTVVTFAGADHNVVVGNSQASR
jgi:hypothetical protein